MKIKLAIGSYGHNGRLRADIIYTPQCKKSLEKKKKKRMLDNIKYMQSFQVAENKNW